MHDADLDRDLDFIRDEEEWHARTALEDRIDDASKHFVCSHCLTDQPIGGSVTMPGEDTHVVYRWCAGCLADAYRERYGDVGLAPYAAEGR